MGEAEDKAETILSEIFRAKLGDSSWTGFLNFSRESRIGLGGEVNETPASKNRPSKSG